MAAAVCDPRASLSKEISESELRSPLPSTSSLEESSPGECGTSSDSLASTATVSSPWGMSMVVTLGSGISATAFGVHLVAYASPWLPSLDLSLLLRLDWGFSPSGSGTPSPPVAAASAAGLLGSSLAAADVLGGRLPLLFVLCIATTFVLLSFLASPVAGASLMSLPILTARALVRQAQILLCKGFTRGQGSFTPASAAAILTQVLALLLKALRTLLKPILSATVPLILLPKLFSFSKITSNLETQAQPPTAGSHQRSRQEGETAERSRLEPQRGCSSSRQAEAGAEEEEEMREGEVGPGSVGEVDLEELVSRLELREVDEAQGSWEMIVDKTSSTVDYCAWRRDPQDHGPTEYKSWTRFYGCTAKHLCAFYLDCEHLASYEAMIKSYENLGFVGQTGQEAGRMVKKYPLCSPREYVLGWRVWTSAGHGPTNTYYCVTKAVEHEGAPRTQSVRRVDAYHCSWRIREVLVEGAGWCAEVDMYLREDSGMQRSMAKLAFRRSIWGYIQSSDVQLRLYPPGGSAASTRSLPLSVEFAKPVPRWIKRRYLPDLWQRENLFSAASDASAEAAEHPNKSLLGSDGQSYAGQEQSDSDRPRDYPIPQARRISRGQVSESGALAVVKKRALPVLAAAAGIGTMALARGPVGLAAKVLVACAVRVLAAEHNVEAKRHPLRISRSRSRSKSSRQLTRIPR